VYVAEHVPDGKRGFYTSFIQITATLGLFVSLGVIVVTQQSMSPATFQAWGWRLPFLLSLVLVSISLYIRIRDEGIAHLHPAQVLRDALSPAPDGRLHKVAEPETGANLAVRRNCRTGRGLVPPASFTRCSICRRFSK